MKTTDELKTELAALEGRQTEPESKQLDPSITAEERAKYKQYVATCREEPWPLERFVELAIRRWGHLLDL